MRALYLGKRRVVAGAFILTLLIVGVVGLGKGIQHGNLNPPDLNASLGRLQIIAYTTDASECRPERPCHGSARYYDVIWIFHAPAPDYVHENWHSLFTLPLQH